MKAIHNIAKENMQWEQLIVDNASRDDIQEKFGVGGVPTIIFINDKGDEIRRFVGYNKGDEKIMKDFIEKQLN